MFDQDEDMVVGARGRESQANLGRDVGNRLYNKLATYMTGHKVWDLTSGFRAVRAEKFKEFYISFAQRVFISYDQYNGFF